MSTDCKGVRLDVRKYIVPKSYVVKTFLLRTGSVNNLVIFYG